MEPLASQSSPQSFPVMILLPSGTPPLEKAPSSDGTRIYVQRPEGLYRLEPNELDWGPLGAILKVGKLAPVMGNQMGQRYPIAAIQASEDGLSISFTYNRDESHRLYTLGAVVTRALAPKPAEALASTSASLPRPGWLSDGPRTLIPRRQIGVASSAPAPSTSTSSSHSAASSFASIGPGTLAYNPTFRALSTLAAAALAGRPSATAPEAPEEGPGAAEPPASAPSRKRPRKASKLEDSGSESEERADSRISKTSRKISCFLVHIYEELTVPDWVVTKEDAMKWAGGFDRDKRAAIPIKSRLPDRLHKEAVAYLRDLRHKGQNAQNMARSHAGRKIRIVDESSRWDMSDPASVEKRIFKASITPNTFNEVVSLPPIPVPAFIKTKLDAALWIEKFNRDERAAIKIPEGLDSEVNEYLTKAVFNALAAQKNKMRYIPSAKPKSRAKAIARAKESRLGGLMPATVDSLAAKVANLHEPAG